MDLGHWTTKLKIEQENLPYGFIYVITNNVNDKKYFGKKQMKSVKKLKPLKGRKNKRHFDIETDWKTYTSSSNELNADIQKYGKDKFTFEILSWCKNKSDLSYEEMKQIILANALYDKDYYNEYVGGRVRIRKA